MLRAFALTLGLLVALSCDGLAQTAPAGSTPGEVVESPKEPPHPIDAAMDACVDKDPSTAGMMACAAEAEKAWDKDMNEAYRELTAALKGPSLEALRQAQRAWIAQRDKEAELHSALRAELQGTMWGPVLFAERVSQIKARALQLRGYKGFLDEGRP